jgi:hypothetical protein
MSDIKRRTSDFLREEADTAALRAGMYERALRGAKVRGRVTLGLVALGVVAILVATGAVRSPPRNGPASSGQVSAPSATPREVRGCPLTTPPNPAFVPPESYPPRPPDLYQKEWYGTEELWTMLGEEGEVWQDLPDEDNDGRLSEKTIWWSDGSSEGLSPITVTGRRLDRPGSFDARGPGGGGFREDIGSFMLVGMEIPAGCWELTATYRSAELSYVVLVEG